MGRDHSIAGGRVAIAPEPGWRPSLASPQPMLVPDPQPAARVCGLEAFCLTAPAAAWRYRAEACSGDYVCREEGA